MIEEIYVYTLGKSPLNEWYIYDSSKEHKGLHETKVYRIVDLDKDYKHVISTASKQMIKTADRESVFFTKELAESHEAYIKLIKILEKIKLINNKNIKAVAEKMEEHSAELAHDFINICQGNEDGKEYLKETIRYIKLVDNKLLYKLVEELMKYKYELKEILMKI